MPQWQLLNNLCVKHAGQMNFLKCRSLQIRSGQQVAVKHIFLIMGKRDWISSLWPYGDDASNSRLGSRITESSFHIFFSILTKPALPFGICNAGKEAGIFLRSPEYFGREGTLPPAIATPLFKVCDTGGTAEWPSAFSWQERTQTQRGWDILSWPDFRGSQQSFCLKLELCTCLITCIWTGTLGENDWVGMGNKTDRFNPGV